MASLRITEIERDLPRLNEWIARQEQERDELRSQINFLNTQTGTLTDQIAAEPNTTVPPDVTSPVLTESGRIVDGVLFSEVVMQYTAPSPLGSFFGVFAVVKDYLGSAELVKVYEHTYVGVAGGIATFRFNLQRTGETITAHFVSKNNSGLTPEDWASAPSSTVVLDGNDSPPLAPTGLASTQGALGNLLNWSANAETNLAGYRVWRNTVDTFGSSTQIAQVGVPRTGSPFYLDKVDDTTQQYFYWTTAITNSNLTSTESASATNTDVDILSINVSKELGLGGAPVSGFGITNYLVKTNTRGANPVNRLEGTEGSGVDVDFSEAAGIWKWTRNSVDDVIGNTTGFGVRGTPTVGLEHFGQITKTNASNPFYRESGSEVSGVDVDWSEAAGVWKMTRNAVDDFVGVTTGVGVRRTSDVNPFEIAGSSDVVGTDVRMRLRGTGASERIWEWAEGIDVAGESAWRDVTAVTSILRGNASQEVGFQTAPITTIAGVFAGGGILRGVGTATAAFQAIDETAGGDDYAFEGGRVLDEFNIRNITAAVSPIRGNVAQEIAIAGTPTSTIGLSVTSNQMKLLGSGDSDIAISNGTRTYSIRGTGSSFVQRDISISADRATIDSGGDMALQGTPNPSEALLVFGGGQLRLTGTAVQMKMDSRTTGDSFLIYNQAGDFRIFDGADKMVMNTSGEVGWRATPVTGLSHLVVDVIKEQKIDPRLRLEDTTVTTGVIGELKSLAGDVSFLRGTDEVFKATTKDRVNLAGGTAGADGVAVAGTQFIDSNQRLDSATRNRAAHTSYTPTTNPLTATDAGATATITIAAFTQRVPGDNISISGGSLTGLAFDTIYYVYYDDEDFAGGSVTFAQTTTKKTVVDNTNRFFAGSIKTPKNGAPDTIGRNDGGVTPQSGLNLEIFAGEQVNNGTWANPENALDSDFTTFATATGVGGPTTLNINVRNFPSFLEQWESLDLHVRTEVSGAAGTPGVTLKFSTDGGASFTNIYVTDINRSLQTDITSLGIGTNIGQIQVQMEYFGLGGGDGAKMDFYEAWIVGVA